ncbi:MAG: hypothetical protein JXR34_07455 [Bacteroidales bacterium]|nr:hypothetical protein [Bacteroidales bacterium]
MQDNLTHLDQLKEIRQIMEKSTKFISLSGISGVWVGFVALAGIAVVLFSFDSYFFTRYSDGGVFSVDKLLNYNDLNRLIRFVLIDALIMLVFAIGGAILLTIRKAKKKGLSVWDKTAKRFLVSLMVPLATGGIFTLILIYHGIFAMAGPATLIFYGLALINAGRFTLNDIRFLGLFEVLLGLLAALFLGYTAIFWAIGFGLLHIIYGLVMYFKYEK